MKRFIYSGTMFIPNPIVKKYQHTPTVLINLKLKRYLMSDENGISDSANDRISFFSRRACTCHRDHSLMLGLVEQQRNSHFYKFGTGAIRPHSTSSVSFQWKSNLERRESDLRSLVGSFWTRYSCSNPPDFGNCCGLIWIQF